MHRRKGAALRRLLLGILACLAMAPAAQAQDDHSDVEIFMWVGGRHLMDAEPEMFRSMLAFAARHGITPYESGAADTVTLKKFLEHTRALGMEKTWIEIGPGRDYTISEFVHEPAKREHVLSRMRDVARVYHRYYPEFGRITIFDEAPLGAFQDEIVGGKPSYLKEFEEFEEHSPQAFAYIFEALKSEMPNGEVGVFLHHPHNAPPAMGGRYSFIAEFMDRASALGATPDFIFSDIYRGYFTRGYGVEATNDYITAVVDYIDEVGERHGADAYQLAQMHTIKIGHTPSRLEIDTNVEAMLAGDPDGIGWYWPNYSATDAISDTRTAPDVYPGYDISFEPFIPNEAGRVGPSGSVYGTSRDRFEYSYLRMLEEVGKVSRAESFDLWLYGHDFDHSEHSVYLRAPGEAEWTYIGTVNPQQDREGYIPEARERFIYSYDGKWHAVVFHALERDRFLRGGEMEVRIETHGGSDGSRFSAAYAMPYRPTRNYLTEAEATAAIEDHARWIRINSLAAHVRPQPRALKAGEAFDATLRDQLPFERSGASERWVETLVEGAGR